MMADVFTPKKRSDVMSRIRASGNRATELRMVALFRRHAITDWRRHDKRVFGKPDFAFWSERVAVFADGCFWHRHKGCSKMYVPKTGRRGLQFWLHKFERNVARDRKVRRQLRSKGWKVLRVWECQLGDRNWANIARRVQRARKGRRRRQTRVGRVKKR